MKTHKIASDNFSEFLSSFESDDSGFKNTSVKGSGTENNLPSSADNSDNFSTFLSHFDGPSNKVNTNLDNILKALSRIESRSKSSNSLLQTQFKGVKDVINGEQIPPIAKAMESVKQLNVIATELNHDQVSKDLDDYKVILKGYIDIAEQTSSNELAAETLNLSEKIINGIR